MCLEHTEAKFNGHMGSKSVEPSWDHLIFRSVHVIDCISVEIRIKY